MDFTSNFFDECQVILPIFGSAVWAQVVIDGVVFFDTIKAILMIARSHHVRCIFVANVASFRDNIARTTYL